MLRKLLFASIPVLGLLAPVALASPAEAHGWRCAPARVFVHRGYRYIRPVCYPPINVCLPPAPIYVTPAPVCLPAPVVQPAPVYIQPRLP
jgi:hypothetical protein